MTVTGFDGYFDALGETECRRLLSAQPVARLGFASEGRILVLPVAIATDGDVVVFATSPDSVLASLRRGADVALQTDEYDAAFLDGWSVLVEGHTFPYSGDTRPELWVLGHDAVLVGIGIDRISGRAIAGPIPMGQS